MQPLIINLKQSNFNKGTVILNDKYYIIANENTNQTEKIIINLLPNQKLIYKLVENIIFKPNNYLNKKFIDRNIPLENQFISNGGFYNDMAYRIGFFAALSLTGNNYVLDLNEYSIKQSYEHYIRQRFYSNIELGNSPFLPKTGPHNFINLYEPCTNVVIQNGTIGRSSHHGIHGNDNNNIFLYKLKFKNFEVAAISLNGSIKTTIKDINILNNNQKIPVLGIWSSALFLYPYIKFLNDYFPSFSLNLKSNTYKAKKLYKEYLFIIENVFEELNYKKYTHNYLFNNKRRLIDGPCYGILLNKHNVAVNGFPTIHDNTNHNHLLENITITNIKGFNNEIPALMKNIDNHDSDNIYLNKNIQNDVVGSVFQTQNFYINNNNDIVPLTINFNGEYIGNIVSNIQLLIAKAIHNNIKFQFLQTSINSINQETIYWAEKNIKLKETNLYYIFQGDSMHHVIKGVIALKLDCMNNSKLENIKIKNIYNNTDKNNILYNDLIGINENDIKPQHLNNYLKYKEHLIPSHNSATYPTNQSSFVRGISLSNSINNTMQNITIKFLSSVMNNIIHIDYHKEISESNNNNEKNIIIK